MTDGGVRRGAVYGAVLGLAYVINVQVLTWMGLGLTGWVFAIDGVLMLSGLVAFQTRGPLRLRSSSGRSATWAALAGMLLTAELIRQAYMVAYVTWIDPLWVESVMEIREELMTRAGLGRQEIQQRLDGARRGFTATAMLTRGAVVPAAWKLLFALVALVPIRALTRARGVAP